MQTRLAGRARSLAVIAPLFICLLLALPQIAYADPTFLREWSLEETPFYGFGTADGVVVHPNGHVYVTNSYNNGVQVFDTNGTYIETWGGPDPGSGPGEFSGPNAITVAPNGDILVANNSVKVQRLTASGDYVSQFGTPGMAPGQLWSIRGLAFDAAGDLYVSEYDNRRIQKFTSAGAFITSWTLPNVGAPYGVAFDSAGDVYVCDYFNSKIHKFTNTGTLLASWVTAFRPQRILVAPDGGFYVTGGETIALYETDGTLVGSWDTIALGAGSVHGWGAALDSSGNLYMTDQSEHRVVVFALGSDEPTVTPPVVSSPASSPWSLGLTAMLVLLPTSAFLGRRASRR